MQANLPLKKWVWGCLLALWSAAAFAAESAFSRDMSAIALVDIAISVVLALIGGAAYSSQKIADPNLVLKSVRAEIVKDSLTSIVVGLVIFFCAPREWDTFTIAGFITLGGYGGSRVLEPLLSWFISKWEKK